VFGHHNEKKAFERAQAAMAQWQTQRDAQAQLVSLATTYTGVQTSDAWC
jgi:uncharacterized protein (UPF0548 family)